MNKRVQRGARSRLQGGRSEQTVAEGREVKMARRPWWANAWLESLSLISHMLDMMSQCGHRAAEAFTKIVPCGTYPENLCGISHVMVTRCWMVAKKAGAGINNRHSIIKLAIRLSMNQHLHEACLFH